MAEKIRVFLDTGTIEEAELLRSDEKFRTLSLFNKVFGKLFSMMLALYLI